MTASHPAGRMVASGEGVVIGAPRRWLSLEGLVLLTGTLIAYGALGQPWWIVPAGILVPDIAMARYLAGTRPGARLPLARRHARRRLLAGRPPGGGPRSGLAGPHRPGPAARHGPEVQRPLHPYPPRRPPGRRVARPRPGDWEAEACAGGNRLGHVRRGVAAGSRAALPGLGRARRAGFRPRGNPGHGSSRPGSADPAVGVVVAAAAGHVRAAPPL